jgi:hypothetical protein
MRKIIVSKVYDKNVYKKESCSSKTNINNILVTMFHDLILIMCIRTNHIMSNPFNFKIGIYFTKLIVLY